MRIVRHRYRGAKAAGIKISEDGPLGLPPLPLEPIEMEGREYRPSLCGVVYFGRIVNVVSSGTGAASVYQNVFPQHFEYLCRLGYGWANIDGRVYRGWAQHRVSSSYPDTSGVYMFAKARKWGALDSRVETSWFRGTCRVSFCDKFLVMHPLEKIENGDFQRIHQR